MENMEFVTVKQLFPPPHIMKPLLMRSTSDRKLQMTRKIQSSRSKRVKSRVLRRQARRAFLYLLPSFFTLSDSLNWTANQRDFPSLTDSAANSTRSIDQKAADEGRPAPRVRGASRQPGLWGWAIIQPLFHQNFWGSLDHHMFRAHI